MLFGKKDSSRANARAGSFREIALAATALTALTGAAQTASAQATSATTKSEEVVVTGSRASRAGYVAPSPTAVIRADVIERQAASGVGQVLVQNPAFKGTRNPGANATNTSSPGQFTADLRALGGQRTLVLVDGSRVVPYAAASNLGSPNAVDLNLLPTLMMDRVEVVTGGASAQYGSDAVAGVVNIFLKRDFEGFRIRAQAGQADQGDYQGQRIGFLAGKNFANDKLHLVVSGEFDRNDGIDDIYKRDWGLDKWMQVTNSAFATNGLPANIIAPNINNSLGAGGVILNSAANPAALRGRAFNSDGSTRPFQFGTLVGGNVMVGGEGDSVIKGVSLIPAVKRYSTFARLGYDFNDNLHGYIEGGLADSKAILVGNFLRSTTLTIRSDNPYLPTAVKTALGAATSFTMSRYSEDMGNNRYEVENKSPHGVIGFEGALGDSGWEWDAHYSYGRNDYTSVVTNQTVGANLTFAIDAYRNPTTGNIVCAATDPASGRFNAAAAGCVPVNLFGAGNPTPAAIAYINQTGINEVRYTQDAAAFNLKGEPFSTWAGPVSTAIGAEYRKENERVTSSYFPANSLFLSGGNAKPWSGGFDVTEGYVEAIVPLARDAAFAKLLDFNAAVRYADYSTAGGQTTWKTGVVWEPTDWLRFRATQSRDIRAPAPNELYGGGSTVTNQLTVGSVHVPASAPQNTTAGNPDVKPEKADTSTVGLVFKPNSGMLSGFRMSVDYYVIDLKDAITNFTSSDVANQCALGSQFFCNMITFASAAPNAAPTSLTSVASNIGARKTSGIDVSIDYEKDFGSFKLATNLSGTNTIESIFDTGIGSKIDRAGENGWANTGSLPSVRGNFSETLTVGKFAATAQAIYISGGKLDVIYNTAANNTTNDNSIPAIAYMNLYGSYEVTPKARVFAAINNVLDRDPPHSPYTVLSSPVNGSYYDKVGRAFQVGLDVRF